MSSKRSSGFTLIELLVVIAIIGILAAIVLVAVNSAKQKADIASIKGGMAQLPNVAALFMANNGSASGVVNSPEFARIVQAAKDIGKHSSNWGDPSFDGICSSDEWFVSVALPDGSSYWCVDSHGNKSSNAPVNVDGCSCDSYPW